MNKTTFKLFTLSAVLCIPLDITFTDKHISFHYNHTNPNICTIEHEKDVEINPNSRFHHEVKM